MTIMLNMILHVQVVENAYYELEQSQLQLSIIAADQKGGVENDKIS
jgi:hypothetical protein